MEYEIKANKYSLNCIKIGIFCVMFFFTMNEIGVFIVDKPLVRKAAIPTLIIYFLTVIIFYKIGLDKPWVKYVLLFIEISTICLLCVFLSYHISLSIAVPFLIAGHYQDKRVIWWTYGMSLVALLVFVIASYQFGLCDMNMVVFSHLPINAYGKEIIVDIESMNWTYVGKLVLFFVFPRAVILFMYARMALSISECGQEIYENKKRAEYISKYDNMTGLYNKNEYLEMIDKVYSHMEQVGVVYLDINGLKDINDNYGHDKGDILIVTVADCIKHIVNDKIQGYRIGGDEFVIVMEDSKEENVEETVNLLEKILRVMNNNAKRCVCEVGIGYAYGNGKNIKSIVDKADENMYFDKKKKNKSKIIDE